jgi:hypothetical protein
MLKDLSERLGQPYKRAEAPGPLIGTPTRRPAKGGGEVDPPWRNRDAVPVSPTITSARSVALGDEPVSTQPPRDRPAEFRTVATDGFGGWVEDMIGQCLGLLDGVTFDPSIEGVRTWTQDLADDPVTASWALLQATSHLGEHVGHLHMTLELLRPAD